MVATNLHTASAPTGPVASSLKDIKPPVEIPNPWLWAGWILGALALAALAFWVWRKWRRRQAQAAMAPPVPPHTRARQRLREALAFMDQPREFCGRVSDAVRWYLEERFDFHAPERTTEEFLHELRATNLLTPDQKGSLGEFLNRCDLVKFARYEPGEPELRDLHGSALRLIEETEPIEATAPETAGGVK